MATFSVDNHDRNAPCSLEQTQRRIDGALPLNAAQVQLSWAPSDRIRIKSRSTPPEQRLFAVTWALGKQQYVAFMWQGNVNVHCLDTWSRLFAQETSDQNPLMYLDVSHARVGDPQASASARFAELLTVNADMETSNQRHGSLICFGSGLTLLLKGLLGNSKFSQQMRSMLLIFTHNEPCCVFICW